MADIADLADSQRETTLALQIAAARRPAQLPPVTDCVECGDPVLPGSRYCCAECRDDGEKRQRMARIQGTP